LRTPQGDPSPATQKKREENIRRDMVKEIMYCQRVAVENLGRELLELML